MDTKYIDGVIVRVRKMYTARDIHNADQAAAELAELKEENEKNRLGMAIHYGVEIATLQAALDEARKIIEEDAAMLISLQNAGHSGDATKVLTAFHHSKHWLLAYNPKAGAE
jgi:methylaspartate ammonia-lyase